MAGSDMPHFVYRCFECKREYERGDVRYLCPVCSKDYRPGDPLRGVLRAEFDYSYIRKRFNKQDGNFELFSAVEEKYFPPYPVGNTPLIESEVLSDLLGVKGVYIKFDGLNPSGSLKDRASFLMVAEAIRLNESRIVCASTGNAASALAAVAASAGREAIIFVPKNAPKAKLVQILLYGAKIILVDGTYDDAFAMSLRYSERNGYLNRNTAYHPLTIEGKKTVALEIYRQMGYRVPDAVYVPVGDGVIISGVYKGFYDLFRTGLIKRIPRLISVQAKGSNAINRFYRSKRYISSKMPTTCADSISVSTPSNANMAVSVIRDSDGRAVDVSDREILKAQMLLASKCGIFAEPAAAASLAGAIRSRELNSRLDSICILVTGHGLKDVDTPLKAMSLPPPVGKDWI